MDNQEIQNEEIEINLAELFQVLKEHLHIIIISTLICAILVGAFTIFFVSKNMNQRLVFSQSQKLTKESLTIHKLAQIIR